MARVPDPLTGDLFAIPTPRQPVHGSLNAGPEVRGLLGRVLKESPLSRFEVAAKMSELVGVEITKYQIDSWTAQSREDWRFPLEYLPALEVACETHAITAWAAEVRGGRLLIGRDALNAELGRLERLRDEAGAKIKQLKKAMGEAE